MQGWGPAADPGYAGPIAVFGATGRTSSLVLQQARRCGWPVRALVRSQAKLAAGAGLAVVEGDARDEQAVQSVNDGAGSQVGAVLCAVGMHDIALPATDFSDSVKTIVAVMKRRGVRRIVAIASAGVLDHPQGGLRNEHGFPAYLRNVSAEQVRNLETLRASGLDWTLTCPMNLVDEVPAGHATWLYDDLPPGSEQTACADLAVAMCDLLTERASLGKRVGIVTVRGDTA